MIRTKGTLTLQGVEEVSKRIIPGAESFFTLRLGILLTLYGLSSISFSELLKVFDILKS